ncbi:hypothetical protein [Pseudogulbenkiania subflava]|uniref:Uncharacterized protein n=1 Tax=Pseudogulbenkiania subflava DSM 22618 TaxID=1123014 RepID=A0A1Y6CAI4_9NEIS|nr:hypothetical protein [Pseudogulbenkiania subflava]SMF52013.1 hypothetical protein SAMN02745746_03736 [Pseudogulbenkiania subflava DSM 22618]
MVEPPSLLNIKADIGQTALKEPSADFWSVSLRFEGHSCNLHASSAKSLNSDYFNAMPAVKHGRHTTESAVFRHPAFALLPPKAVLASRASNIAQSVSR